MQHDDSLEQPPTTRARLGLWIESVPVQQFITGLIVLNAITLGIQTSADLEQRFGSLLLAVEWFVLVVFVVEILIKLYCFRLKFFKSGWNLMDFAIVGIALLPASGPLAILRSLRILRVLRLLSTVPRLRQLTESLLLALPSIGWILFMLGLVFYIFGVLGTELFGEAFPQWFGTLGGSIYSLFQIMTLESWSMGIARPVIEAFPKAWVFFVVFILIATFTMLNLFIAVIVNAIQAEHDREMLEAEQETAQHVDDQHEVTRREIASLRGEIRQLHELLLAAGKPANKP